jgi:hypothetical protein
MLKFDLSDFTTIKLEGQIYKVFGLKLMRKHSR